MGEKTKAVGFCNDTPWVSIDRVFAHGRCEKFAEITGLYPERITIDNFEQHVGNLNEVDVIFSTWDMPNLKAVFYAAGATTYLREPFEENGIIVCSATAANTIPIAEFVLAQILLAGAGYWRTVANAATRTVASATTLFCIYEAVCRHIDRL